MSPGELRVSGWFVWWVMEDLIAYSLLIDWWKSLLSLGWIVGI
ncbi:hypothetical protein [Klebsiella pneumoniae]|nr:hypothetical protein [Klebsiella pneumoniae]